MMTLFDPNLLPNRTTNDTNTEEILPEWVNTVRLAVCSKTRCSCDGAGFVMNDHGELDHCQGAEWWPLIEDVLATVVPAIKAQALREAAETVRRYNLPDAPGSMYPSAVADALRERAAHIEREGLS